MDSNTVLEKYPHLTAQAMEATGESDPKTAIEALLAEQGYKDTQHTAEDAYSQLSGRNRAVVKELIEYIIDNWQNGEGATA